MDKSDVSSPNITQMLREWGEGRKDALDELLPLVYSELHRQASNYLRRERPGHTLQTTALVHEAYLKIVGQKPGMEWQSRSHFFAIAANAMRHILVDYARNRNREKRGGPEDNLPLEEAFLAATGDDVDLPALDEAMTRFGLIDERATQVVELRYFVGLSLDETAETLGISRATAARDWEAARAWLHRELTR
ncbi:MAG: sigma-70 family RNA polymerase sigma factor [Pyrinomonadaceae bacterium]